MTDLLELPTFRFHDGVRTYHLDGDCKRNLRQRDGTRLRDELITSSWPYPCTRCALPRALDAVVAWLAHGPAPTHVACCRMAQPTSGWRHDSVPSPAMLDDAYTRAELLSQAAERLGGRAVDVQSGPWVRYALVPVWHTLSIAVRNTVGTVDNAAVLPPGTQITARLVATVASLHEGGMPLADALPAAAALDR